MKTPDKLLEPDRYHWMAFPLDRASTGLSAVLERESELDSGAEPSGRDMGAPASGESRRPAAPPVRDRVFNPELKRVTRDVLKHPAEKSDTPVEDSGGEGSASHVAGGAVIAAGVIAAGVATTVGDQLTSKESASDETTVAEAAEGKTAASVPETSEVSEAPDATIDATPASAPDDESAGTDTETLPASTRTPSEPADLSWLSPVPPPMPLPIIRNLFQLFQHENVKNEDFREIMQYIRKTGKADALACVLFDPIDFVYRLYLHDAIDASTRKNLFFALNDKFLDSTSPVSILRFGDFKDDFFFSKRFSTDFFKRMQGIVLLNLNVYELPGYFMLFYRDLESRDDEKLREMSESIIRDLIPLVQRLRRTNGLVHYRTTLEDSRDNYTLRMYQLLKELSHGGKDTITVVHATFTRRDTGTEIRPYLIQICEKLRKVLAPEERVLILPPGRISILMKSDQSEAVIGVIKAVLEDEEANLDFEPEIMRYPENGRNLLNYMR